jgi:hypothetical protein
MTFLGIDLHTNCFSCCYLKDDGSKHADTFRLDEDGLARFYATLDKTTYVLIEATVNTC